jgi:hypothetical protein
MADREVGGGRNGLRVRWWAFELGAGGPGISEFGIEADILKIENYFRV